MTIIFLMADGSKRVLKPMRPIPNDIIRTLASDFGATKYEVK